MVAQFARSSEEYLVDVFRALSDPMRLDVMCRILNSDEVACTELESVLPVTKSTISYHMKILHQAGLINIRKAGRYYFYQARRDENDDLLPGVWQALERAARLESSPG
jgi:DNA-binding transcriptional ArsR family regulator